MRIKYFLLIISLFCFISCFEKENDGVKEVKYSAEKQKSVSYLTFYSSEYQLRGDAVNSQNIISFGLPAGNFPLEKYLDKGKYDLEDYFQLTPPIEGEFSFANAEFRLYPKEELAAGRSYEGSFKLSKILKDRKDIPLSFKTKARDLISLTSKLDIGQKECSYQHSFRLYPEISPERVKEAIWLKTKDQNFSGQVKYLGSNEYLYSSEKISLKEQKQNLNFSLNGQKLGFAGKLDYEKNIIVPEINSEFEVLGIEQSIEKNRSSLNLIFNRELVVSSDYKPYITIFPSTEFEAEVEGRKLVLAGHFNAGTSYKVIVASGLKSKSGEEISEAKTYQETILVNDLKPACLFTDNKSLLSTKRDFKISFRTVNLKRVRVTLYRIFTENTFEFLQSFGLKSKKDRNYYYQEGNYNSYEFSQKSEVIYKEIVDLGQEKNIWQNTQLDLSSQLKKEKSSFYVVKLSYDEDDLISYPDDERYWNIRYYVQENGTKVKHLLYTDLALSAINDREYLIVTAYNVKREESQENVKITVKNSKYKTIGSGVTGEDGTLKLKLTESSPQYLIGNGEGYSSYLVLSENILDKSLFDISGKKPTPLETFIYSDRDVYRPGDEIHLAAIIRASEGDLPANYPVKAELYNPRNIRIYSKSSTAGLDGHYAFSFPTKMEDLTGNWSVKISAGGQVFAREIKVETIVPYKLKVGIVASPKNIELGKTRELKVETSAKFLFGAPASKHKSKTVIKIEPDYRLERKYQQFIFHHQSSAFTDLEEEEYAKNLDKNGKTIQKFIFPDESTLKNLNAPLNINIESRVFETGGRPVVKELDIPLNPFSAYVGIEKVKNNRLQEGEAHTFNLMLADQAGKKIKSRNLSYKLYRMKRYWWWHFDNENSFRKHYKSDSETYLVKEGEARIESGLGKIKLNFPDYGAMLLEVTDEESGHTAGYFFQCGWSGESGSKNADVTTIDADKESYFAKETAKLIINTPKSGTLFWAIENRGVITKKGKKKITGFKTEFDLDLSESDIPNLYFLATVIQDKEDNDLPKRLFAIKKIVVKPKGKNLNYDLNFSGKKLEPEKEFTVSISTKEKVSSSLTLAVIDEGLLDITGYQTPDPYNYFYSPFAMYSKIYDNLGDFIGPDASYIHRLIKVGGGVYNKKKKKLPSQEALQNLKRFETVALYKGPFKTDKNGNAIVKFQMPNYLGSVKVIAVGCNKDSYGSCDQVIPVKSDLMISTSLPRVAGPEDEFEMPVTVFYDLDQKMPLTLSVITEEGLNIPGKSKFMVESPEQQNKFKFTLKAEKVAKTVKIMVKAETKIKTYQKDYYLTIRPYQPYTYNSQDQVAESDSTITFKVPEEGIKGTSAVTLSLSLLPDLNLEKRVKWLIRYPYGCVEQTVSTGFPQLSLTEFISADEKKRNEITANVNKTIERLKKFQVENGGFSYWPGGKNADYWGTNYALNFLLEAKDKGYQVSTELLNKALNYQKKMCRVTKSGNYLTKTFRLYLLAKADKVMLSQMNYLKESKVKDLDNAALAYLALAYKLAGYPEVGKQLLTKIAKENKSNQDWYYETYGSSLRNKAILAMAYLAFQEKKKAALIIKDIAKKISTDNWYSTQTLGYCLNTLALYLQNQDKEKGLDFVLNSKTLKDEAYKINRTIYSFTLEDHFGEKIEIMNKMNQPLFATLVWEGIPLKLTDLKPVHDNIDLNVFWYDEKGKELKIDSLPSGKTFYAHIKLSKDRYYTKNEIAVTQVLPSGWEIENLRLKNKKLPDFLSHLKLKHIDYTDIRDDRISWFFDAKRYTSSYDFVVKLNSVTKGKYKLPPTIAEAMYDNSCKAVTKSKKVKVY